MNVIPPGQFSVMIEADSRERYAKIVRAVQLAVQIQGPRIAAEVIAATDPQPVDRGAYHRNWLAQDIERGSILYNNTKYASILEDGRRPGGRMPPKDLIEAWLSRKKIMSKKDAKRLAWVFARAIARKGIRPRRVLSRIRARLDPIVRAAADEAAAAD